MKYVFVFGLVAALCFLGVSCNEETAENAATEAAPENKEKICEPGTRSMVQCNSCICSTDGTELACTKKICVEGMEDVEVKAENLPATDGEEVKAENLPVPEADLSQVPGPSKERRRRSEDEDTCEPGKNFKRDCNDCECPASGKKSEANICTTIAC